MDKAAKLKRWRNLLDSIEKKASMLEGYEQVLSFYGRIARQYESSATRYSFLSKKLREQILEIMRAHDLREFKASTRTFLRIDYVYTIPDGDEGKEKVSEVRRIFGKATYNDLVVKEEVIIPRQKLVHYRVVPEEINKLSKAEREKLTEILGNKPKLYIIDIPKRTRQGKAIRRYRGK